VVAGPVGYRWPTPTHYGPDVPWLARPPSGVPWAGFMPALGMATPGRARVVVMLPPDVDGWALPAGSSCIGDLVYRNGDSLDVRLPSGDIEPFDAELCRVFEPGWFDRPAVAVAATEFKGTNYRATGGPQSPMRASDSLYIATGRRRLTVDECRILLGFPEGYPFQGTSEARYRQIGNAVAPVVAMVLGEGVKNSARILCV